MTSLPWRRIATVTAASSALLLSVLVAPPASQADDSSTLTVVGTSDVYDSNLVQSVLKPGFEAAYPQYTLNYISKGTGPAIDYAKAGTASALLVHAASLENQFVDQHYSAETYGRAIFYGDYVLLGPESDPAGVLTNAPHDIATAFERIAAAGEDDQANFVSRGGTPGTTVQEHAIWALTNGVTTCKVPDEVLGGGASPSTTTGDCPSTISYPSWYHATGLTQGPNLVNADACNYPTGPDNCYVFTDRGTYQYLESTNAISNLDIVTRDNAADARGGQPLLINSFHAYAINPDAFTDPVVAAGINLPAAEAFLNWITSPEAQAAVGTYLNGGGDAPFLPDAAPRLESSILPSKVSAGEPLTADGTLSNVVPGTPPLDDATVRLRGVPLSDPSANPRTLARTTTDATGAFSFSYSPRRGFDYSLSVPRLTRVERPDLDPVFGDLLAPTSLELGAVHVGSSVTLRHVGKSGHQVTLSGGISPKVIGDGGRLHIMGSNGGDFVQLAGRDLAAGATHYNVTVHLGSGDWTLKTRYTNSGEILPSTSETKQVTIN